MALPDKRDPYEDRVELENRRRLDNANRTTGSWFAWWWIWVLFIIAIIWFAGWGWGGYGGWWWGRGAANGGYAAYGNGVNTNANGVNGGANAAQVTGSGLTALNATDKKAFVGEKFVVNDVPVQNKVNDQVFWVGVNNKAPMLVVLGGGNNASNGGGNNASSANAGGANSLKNANIDQGTRVDVMGTVEKAPSAAQAKKEWSLGGDAAKRLEQEGAYVRANQVVRAQPGQQQ